MTKKELEQRVVALEVQIAFMKKAIDHLMPQVYGPITPCIPAPPWNITAFGGGGCSN